MSGTARVERHRLALAVAMLWTVSAGGQAEAAEEASRGEGATEAEEGAWLEGLARPTGEPPASGVPTLERGPEDASPGPKGVAATPGAHLVSVFRRGWMILSQALAEGRWIDVSWHPGPLIKPVVAQAGLS